MANTIEGAAADVAAVTESTAKGAVEGVVDTAQDANAQASMAAAAASEAAVSAVDTKIEAEKAAAKLLDSQKELDWQSRNEAKIQAIADQTATLPDRVAEAVAKALEQFRPSAPTQMSMQPLNPSEAVAGQGEANQSESQRDKPAEKKKPKRTLGWL